MLQLDLRSCVNDSDYLLVIEGPGLSGRPTKCR